MAAQEKPVIILNINQRTGFSKIQCNKIAIDPKEANAANTLMCPTFLISFGH